MKIRQKLMLGFVGTSLLVGVTSCISVLTLARIRHDVAQLNQSSIKEVAASNEMIFALESIQTSAQELMAEKSIVSLKPTHKAKAGKEVKQQLKNINYQLNKVDQNLRMIKVATVNAIHLASGEPEEIQEELNQLKVLAQMKAELFIHKKLVDRYIYIVNIDTLKANEFLDNILKTHLRSSLLPLIREYQAVAEAEIVREALEVEEAAASGKTIILVSTLVTLFIAMSLGIIISHRISTPIIKLKEAAVQISQGKVETRVDIKHKSEIGILANAFNQMLDDLSTITVSKSYLDRIINSMAETLMVISPDATITSVNSATINLLGYRKNELIGKHIQVVFAGEELFKGLKIDDLIKKGFMGNVEKTYLTKSGRKIPVSCSGSVMHDDNGKIQGIVCVAQDITERKRAELALRESEERYALAAHGANDGLWDWNMKTNKVYYSPRWKSMLGYEALEIGDSPDEWFNRVHPEDIELVLLKITAHQELTPQLENEHRTLHSHQEFEHYILHFHYEVEHRMLHLDGTYRWMLNRGIALQNLDGKTYRLAGSQTDITERKWAEAQLRHDALHDKLTGLPNRVLFMERLGHAIKRAKGREDYLFAVLFLDLNRFKVVNDSLGHIIGDQLLIAIARKLQACVRGDTIARLGGDEFTILLDNIQGLEDATQVAERIQQELTLPFNLSGYEVFTAASIGIALSTTDYDKPEDLLRDADTTMYHAKAQGTIKRYEVFNKAMHTKALALLQLETDLRRALERQEFRLHYQPIVTLNSGRISGFEALIRWQHPSRGLVSPAELIPIAEATGLIVPIGWWVLEEACRQMHALQVQFPTEVPLTISVNFSTKQFSQPNVVEQIAQILRSTGLNASSLGLEITESAIMENAETATTTLWQLQCLGVKLFLDDFGTGYSSLSYLYRFPFTTLKIDRSFVNRMGVHGENSEIVRTIITLAHSMSMNVTAEGVETATQLAQLRALKCEYGQGYFFSKPVDSKAAGAILAAQPQ